MRQESKMSDIRCLQLDEVAEVLGISPRTLYRKLDEYGFK